MMVFGLAHAEDFFVGVTDLAETKGLPYALGLNVFAVTALPTVLACAPVVETDTEDAGTRRRPVVTVVHSSDWDTAEERTSSTPPEDANWLLLMKLDEGWELATFEAVSSTERDASVEEASSWKCQYCLES